MPEYLLVSTTADSQDGAAMLMRSAVRERLAASGQVFGPALSAFWHLGKFGEGEEWQVLLKTEADRYAELEAHLIEKHPWQNPEVTAIKIAEGSAPYLEWISRATSQQE
jgi:periplasmic divalent cation tolerance protein